MKGSRGRSRGEGCRVRSRNRSRGIVLQKKKIVMRKQMGRSKQSKEGDEGEGNVRVEQ